MTLISSTIILTINIIGRLYQAINHILHRNGSLSTNNKDKSTNETSNHNNYSEKLEENNDKSDSIREASRELSNISTNTSKRCIKIE